MYMLLIKQQPNKQLCMGAIGVLKGLMSLSVKSTLLIEVQINKWIAEEFLN